MGAQAMNYLLKKYSYNPSELYDVNKIIETNPGDATIFGIRKNPVSQIYNLFQTGKWLNTYELPFFKETYLKADQYKNWEVGSLASTLGDDGKAMAGFIKDGLNIQFPMAPTFKLEDVSKACYDEGDLSFDFYLINKDNYWLDRNFRFLQAFYAGTQWLQLDFGFIQGTNVYNVLCPGRFNILWASVGSTITFVGKLRKNNFMTERYGTIIKSIDNDVLWPDAWKVDIKIKSLVPNNFNMYMNYYLHGYGTAFKKMRETTELNNASEMFGLGKLLKDKTLGKEMQKAKEAQEQIRDKNIRRNSSVLMNIHDSKYKLENSNILRKAFKQAGYSDQKIDAIFEKINRQQEERKERERREREEIERMEEEYIEYGPNEENYVE